MDRKPKLLWVGDAGVPSGYALSTHKILDVVKDDYDVTVLGVNYRGDPHPWPYPMYAAHIGGDVFGIGRLIWTLDVMAQTVQDGAQRKYVPMGEWTKPDIIVIQSDPWNFQSYLEELKKFPDYARVPVVAIMAVDGKNMPVDPLVQDLDVSIFWTNFGLDEMRRCGYLAPGTVIPLGVDTDTFYPMDKHEARLRMGLPKQCDDAFIVGNVNRNQPRKRWDLTIKYFAEFLHHGPLKDAYLFLHAAPTMDSVVKIDQLASYYGISSQVLKHEPPAWIGVNEATLRMTYNCFDVQVNTGQGEGFGLTTLEGMACGVMQIVGGWSGLGDWALGAAVLIPCTSTAIGPPFVNVIGGVPDETQFVEALCSAYTNLDGIRDRSIANGLALARNPRFNWSNIGKSVKDLLDQIVRKREESEVVQTLG